MYVPALALKPDFIIAEVAVAVKKYSGLKIMPQRSTQNAQIFKFLLVKSYYICVKKAGSSAIRNGGA